MKALLIDDSPTMRNILAGILTQVGVDRIEQATDGVEGLSKAAALGPDVVLVDWTLPDADGVTLVRKLRAAGSRAAIFVLGGESGPQRAAAAVEAGATDYLVKPFSARTLAQRMREALSRTVAVA